MTLLTAAASIFVAVWVCVQDNVPDTARVTAAVVLAAAALYLAVRRRKVVVPLLALIAPWADILAMWLVFLVWGGAFANS